jgi:hypothetical protein
MIAYLAHPDVSIIPALVCVVEDSQVEAGPLALSRTNGMANDIIEFLGVPEMRKRFESNMCDTRNARPSDSQSAAVGGVGRGGRE